MKAKGYIRQIDVSQNLVDVEFLFTEGITTEILEACKMGEPVEIEINEPVKKVRKSRKAKEPEIKVRKSRKAKEPEIRRWRLIRL